ncbi:MAG: DUF2919 family protein [Magnetococcales bacterium]|nr:DUF2919 family protein [Magnetococcales bacterium]
MASTDQTQTMTIEEAIQVAIDHHQNGELEKARDIYRQILTVEPDYPDALHLLGVIAHQAGRDDRALELIQRAIQVRPDQAMYYNNLAETLRALGRAEEAIPQYEMALEIQPDLVEAMNNLGLLFLETGQLDQATDFFRKVVDVQPKLVLALNNLGHCLRTKGEYVEAIQMFRRSLEVRPDYELAKQNLEATFKEFELSDRYDPAVAARLRSNVPDPMRTYLGVEEEDAQEILEKGLFGRHQPAPEMEETSTEGQAGDGDIDKVSAEEEKVKAEEEQEKAPPLAPVEKPQEETWRTRYPVSYYNPLLDVLKVPPLLWLAMFYQMRHVLLLILGVFGRTPWVVGWALEQPIYLVGDIFPMVVGFAVGSRLPEAGPKVRRLWRLGRWLLMLAIVIDSGLILYDHGDTLHTFPLVPLLFLGGNALVLLYIMFSGRVRDLFLSFPSYVPPEKKDKD